MTIPWTIFDKPIPVKQYGYDPGVQIRIEYKEGLASNPGVIIEELLIGEINAEGGTCDDCSIFHYKDCVVIASRKLIDSKYLGE